MKTNEERNSHIAEAQNLRNKLTKDEIRRMIGAECTGTDDKGDQRALSDQTLVSVTGGFDEKSDGYFTVIYACPKCNGAHAARVTMYNGSGRYTAYWSNGCIDFTNISNVVSFPTLGSLVCEIELNTTHQRFTGVVVCYTQQGETMWYV